MWKEVKRDGIEKLIKTQFITATSNIGSNKLSNKKIQK